MKREDWFLINWACQDCEIARVLNVSREAVRLQRERCGKPQSPEARQRKASLSQQFRDFVTANSEALSGKRIAEIVNASGLQLSRQTAQTLLQSLGVVYSLAREHLHVLPWESMNWRLSNSTLRACWHQPDAFNPQAISQNRCNNNHRPATSPETIEDVHAELAKAAEFWSKKPCFMPL
jgi:hypothetical protein